MLKIGLTGNIGSGKSLVCQVFEKLAVPIYYADIEAKKILDSLQLRSKLILEFGSEIEDKANDRIDRDKLAKIVFSNKDKLAKLNALIHPQVRFEFDKWCKRHEKEPYILQEAAILFESGISNYFDKTIVVSASKPVRLKRLLQRDKASKDEILARMKNQWKDGKKEAAADYIIRNDGQQLILPQILKLHQLFINLK